jgi:hypothetical protein
MMGLAGGGARNAQRTLAGEGVATILRVTSNVNLFKLASMRMVRPARGRQSPSSTRDLARTAATLR